MTEAPKKVWVLPEGVNRGVNYVTSEKMVDEDVLYIRADLVDGLVNALEKGDYKPYCDCEECKKTREMLKALEEE